MFLVILGFTRLARAAWSKRDSVTGMSLACQLSRTLAVPTKVVLLSKSSHGHLAAERNGSAPHSGVVMLGSQLSVSQPTLACDFDFDPTGSGFCSLPL